MTGTLIHAADERFPWLPADPGAPACLGVLGTGPTKHGSVASISSVSRCHTSLWLCKTSFQMCKMDDGPRWLCQWGRREGSVAGIPDPLLQLRTRVRLSSSGGPRALSSRRGGRQRRSCLVPVQFALFPSPGHLFTAQKLRRADSSRDVCVPVFSL